MTAHPVTIVPGRLTTVTMPYSEVCMHLGVAGKEMQIVLLVKPSWWTPMVQLYTRDTEPFSFPILCSEAGVRARPDGSYYAIAITDESAPV